MGCLVSSDDERIRVEGEDRSRTTFGEDSELLLGTTPQFLFHFQAPIMLNQPTSIIAHLDHEQA